MGEQQVADDGGWLGTALGYIREGVEVFAAVPQHVWAVVLAVVIASLGTQFLKRVLPFELTAALPVWDTKAFSFLRGNAGELAYKSLIRLVAFAIGFTSCYILWPEPVYKLVVSCFTALAAPLLYKVVMLWVYKKWPHLQGKLSGYPDDV